MYKWHTLMGKFRFEERRVVFQEGPTTGGQPENVGSAISNQRFSGGMLRGTVRFNQIGWNSACQFIISYNPETCAFVSAGIESSDASDIEGPYMFIVRRFDGTRTENYVRSGDRRNLQANLNYDVAVRVTGSRLTLTVDDVDVAVTNLPFVIPHNQVGIWCQDTHEIVVSDFEVDAQRPTAFVVMQFTKPYNELYSEVVQPICEEFQIASLRADESYSSGLIIADVTKQIAEATLVVAEVTPENPNVYYEVGYAHALNKPTILIAEKGTKLPFDVSPFRVLLYENSIDGKRRVEEGLRKHIRALVPYLANQQTV